MISIVGPGGVGGLLAGLLIRAGISTTVVARPATAARLTREGLAIDSDTFGRFQVPVIAAAKVPPNSEVILCVKSYGLADVLPLVVDSRPTRVLSVLNGVAHAPILHATLDDVAPTGCGTVRVVTVRQVDGVIRHTSDYLEVALPDVAADWAMGDGLAAAGVTVLRGGDENTVMWRKFHFLAGMALLTAWADEPMGPALVADPALTSAFLAELSALATAEGFPVSAAALATKLGAVAGDATSSFRTDVRASGLTEIDSLGFDLLRRARTHGLAIPAITKVVTDIAGRLGVAVSID